MVDYPTVQPDECPDRTARPERPDPMVELRGSGPIRDWGVWGQTLLLPGTVGTDPATPKGYDVLAGDCSAKYGVKS